MAFSLQTWTDTLHHRLKLPNSEYGNMNERGFYSDIHQYK